MTRKEAGKIIKAIAEVRNYTSAMEEIDEFISKVKKYLDIEGVCFAAHFCRWHNNFTSCTPEEVFDLDTFLPPEDQKSIIKSMVKALEKKREEYATGLQKANERLKGLMKEVLNE